MARIYSTPVLCVASNEVLSEADAVNGVWHKLDAEMEDEVR